MIGDRDEREDKLRWLAAWSCSGLESVEGDDRPDSWSDKVDTDPDTAGEDGKE